MAPFFMLDSFLDYLTTQKRFSEHTCLAYRKDIQQFLDFTGVTNQKEIKEVDSKLIRGWMVDLIDNEYENISVNRKLSSLRTYFKWLLKEGVIESNPVGLVEGPKVRKRPPSFAQQNELRPEKIVEYFEDNFDGVRDRLLFEILYQTGIRSSELIGLMDASVQNNQIKVLGKRNKERIIPITSELSQLIDSYRELRSEIPSETSHFFVRNNGKKLYPKFVYGKINHYLGKVTDLEKKSPHVLRHTFATHMLNNGAGLEVLKELLGHANLSATQVYTHNSFTELTHIYSQSHPRGRKN
ncbi:MAG: tyrosine recombinase XerC [Crocinitomicaceae bacterium]